MARRFHLFGAVLIMAACGCMATKPRPAGIDNLLRRAVETRRVPGVVAMVAIAPRNPITRYQKDSEKKEWMKTTLQPQPATKEGGFLTRHIRRQVRNLPYIVGNFCSPRQIASVHLQALTAS